MLIVQILMLLAGLAMVLLGADLLVEHASRLARRWGVSEFVIGATIVALGTSAPEMVVSFIGALRGNGDLAAGNILGSNFFNTAMILGLSALIRPLPISRLNLRRDLPANLAAALLLVLLGVRFRLAGIGMDGISRPWGLLLVALFAGYMYLSFQKEDSGTEEPPQQPDTAARPIRRSAGMLLVGLVLLVAGGRLFVDTACVIATMAGLSDKFIAITVLAAGTSLPELATSCVAAAKGRTGLALGNVLGSNIANVLLVLGGAALLHPIRMDNILPADFTALTASAVLLFVCVFLGRCKKISRFGGLVLLSLEAAYMVWLLSSL